MLLHIINQCTKRELQYTENADVKDVLEKEIDIQNDKGTRKESLRNKVRSVGRMAKMLRTLRDDTDSIVKLGAIGGYDAALDRTQLLSNKPSIAFSSKEFSLASTLDAKNEKRPNSPSSSSTKSSKISSSK
jgi:hypothetical protein